MKFWKIKIIELGDFIEVCNETEHVFLLGADLISIESYSVLSLERGFPCARLSLIRD